MIYSIKIKIQLFKFMYSHSTFTVEIIFICSMRQKESLYIYRKRKVTVTQGTAPACKSHSLPPHGLIFLFFLHANHTINENTKKYTETTKGTCMQITHSPSARACSRATSSSGKQKKTKKNRLRLITKSKNVSVCHNKKRSWSATEKSAPVRTSYLSIYT